MSEKQKPTLAELLKGHHKEATESNGSKEFDWGRDVGKEILPSYQPELAKK